MSQLPNSTLVLCDMDNIEYGYFVLQPPYRRAEASAPDDQQDLCNAVRTCGRRR